MAKGKKKTPAGVHKVTPIMGGGECFGVVERIWQKTHAELRLVGVPGFAFYSSSYDAPADVKVIRAACEVLKAEIDAYVNSLDNFPPIDIAK